MYGNFQKEAEQSWEKASSCPAADEQLLITTPSLPREEKQASRGNSSAFQTMQFQTSDYDLSLFPDRIKDRLVVKFKLSLFLSEALTRGAFASFSIVF